MPTKRPTKTARPTRRPTLRERFRGLNILDDVLREIEKQHDEYERGL